MLRRLLITLIPVVLGLPSVALGDQIAQISEVDQTNSYVLTDNYSVNGQEIFSVTNLAVKFSFDPNLPIVFPDPVLQNELALLNVYVTSTTPGGSGFGSIGQSGFSGTFSITDNSGGVNQGNNLLSVTFGGNGSVSGIPDGNGMQFNDSDTGTLTNEVMFTSAYLNFSYYTETEVAQFTVSDLVNSFALDSHDFLVSNNGAGVGTFSATPTPPVVTAEPDTVVLVSGAALLGIGIVLRKRRFRPVF